MRVWIVNHYALPPTRPGGTRHYSLARELIRKGHEVTIIASSFDHTVRKETRLRAGETWKEELVEGVPFLWLRTPPYPGNTLARMWNMAVFAGRVWTGDGVRQLQRPDVILGSSPHLFGALAAERLARRYRVPFVLEVRDLWPQTLIDLGNLSPHHPVVRGLEWIERYLYRNATRIITLLPGAAGYMIGKGAERGKVVWIPNGVDLSSLPAPKPPIEDGVFTVMYAGAHGLANGLDSLLDAAAILQRDGWGERLRFRFIGDGPEKSRLRTRVRDERLEPMVRFEEPVAKSRLHGVLQEADAFLMVLKDSPVFRWGVSPNKLFDYLSSGRPVIFCVNSPYDPVVEAQAGLSVPPEDSKAIAEAIKQLATTVPDKLREMGLRGRTYVEKHHDYARLADKLGEVLNEALYVR